MPMVYTYMVYILGVVVWHKMLSFCPIFYFVFVLSFCRLFLCSMLMYICIKRKNSC